MPASSGSGPTIWADFVKWSYPPSLIPVLNQDVRALWQHDPAYVLGRSSTGTLQMRTDDHGLRSKSNRRATTWATDALASMRRGDVSQMSFAFSVEEDEWTEDESGMLWRRLVRARALYDVSPVDLPCLSQTTVDVRAKSAELRAQRGNGQEQPPSSQDQTRARLEGLRRELMLKEIEV